MSKGENAFEQNVSENEVPIPLRLAIRAIREINRGRQNQKILIGETICVRPDPKPFLPYDPQATLADYLDLTESYGVVIITKELLELTY